MSKTYLMALDLGNSAVRCLFLEVQTGAVTIVKRAWTHPAAPNTSGLGYDLDTADLWSKLGEISRQALRKAGAEPGEVAGVSVTSMRHSTLLIDDRGDVLFAAPTRDARAYREALVLSSEQGEHIHATCGHWPNPVFMGARLLWLMDNAQDLLDKATKVLSLSDWVALRMGGGIYAERSQASATLLFDLNTGDWAHDLISSLGIPADIFPEIVPAGTATGKLTSEAGAHLGLVEGTPIAAGGADTQSGLLGAGVLESGEIGVIAGSTLPIQQVTAKPVLDPEGGLWTLAHLIDGLFVLESNGMMAGSALDWFAKILYRDYDRPIEVLLGEAARSEPGAGGVFSSIGVNIFDASSIGFPVGNLSLPQLIDIDTTEMRYNISRALIEGVAYSARANIEQLIDITGLECEELKVSGHMSVAPLLTQMLSDVTARVVKVSSTHEVSALGAAVCAGVGAGIFPDLVTGAREAARTAREHAPGENSQKYQDLYDEWKEAHLLRAPSDDYVSDCMVSAVFERVLKAEPSTGTSFGPRILVTAPMDDASLEELGKMGDVEYSPWQTKGKIYKGGAELASALEGYNVLVTEIDIVDFEAIRELPALKAVVSCRGNPVNIDIESATAFGIPVLYTPGRNADAVADLTVAFMIMLARKMPGSIDFLKEEGGEGGDLARQGEAYLRFKGSELWKKTVGIVGMGNVGIGVARRVRAFGAAVVFYDPEVTEEQGVLLNTEKATLDELLARSDFVTLHAPATDDTRHMMDGEAFAKMKERAFFINTARASLVDEEALAEALESGQVAGAALDVFSVEPPASDNPIVSRDNVIATPHIGGDTSETSAHQGSIVIEQLGKLVLGETPDHIMNPEVLEDFDWTGPRREPPQSELERLAGKPKPTISS